MGADMIVAGGTQKTATVCSPMRSSGVGNGSPTCGTKPRRRLESTRALFGVNVHISLKLMDG